MKSPILVKRYTQGLAGALKDESDFVAVSRELTEFQGLLSSHGVLKGTLASPFVAARKKAQASGGGGAFRGPAGLPPLLDRPGACGRLRFAEGQRYLRRFPQGTLGENQTDNL